MKSLSKGQHTQGGQDAGSPSQQIYAKWEKLNFFTLSNKDKGNQNISCSLHSQDEFKFHCPK